MSPLARMRNSRESWKSKATARSDQLCDLRKTKARHCRRIDDLQAQVKTLEQNLELKKTVNKT